MRESLSKSYDTIGEKIDEKLATLPPEIAEQWEQKHGHLPAQEQLDDLSLFLQRRQNALRHEHSINQKPERIETLHLQPLAIAQVLKNIEQGDYAELGAGRAGRVIASVRQPDVCYKIMFPTDRTPPETNEIGKETDLQDTISELGEMHGTRVPKVFYFIKDGDTRAIAMERLDAVPLQAALDGTEAFPETFDPELFLQALSRYIRALNEKGFYHRDLHAGNIMIDNETGMPRVIDFGSATFTQFPDEAYRKRVVKGGQEVNIVLKSDVRSLELLQNKIRKRFE